MDANNTISSGGTIPLEDDSFFEFQSEQELNLSLYNFDNDNKFEEDNVNTLTVFKDFSNRKITNFTGLKLLTFLNKWSSTLKCTNIISTIEENEKPEGATSTHPMFQFNGFDVKSEKRTNDLKSLHNKLTLFYAAVFTMSKNDDNLITSIWAFRTFYISLHDSVNGKLKEIIAAATFYCDPGKQYVYIYWIGAALSLSESESKLPSFDNMKDGYQRIGLCTFLIQAIIKYCSIDNTNKTTIFLQCSTNRGFAVSFYKNNGFTNKPNDIKLIPNEIIPKERYFINEDQISIMICKHGHFERKCKYIHRNRHF